MINKHIFLGSIVFLKRLLLKNTIKWKGDYSSWEDAEHHCVGYDDASILHKVSAAALKVKNREAVYERDSVVFYETNLVKEFLQVLLGIASQFNNNLNILDFGGSLGSTYYQYNPVLSPLVNLRWNIIEQKHYIEFGKEHFKEPNLNFYYTIGECFEHTQPNMLLSAGVIQVLEKPYYWLEKFLETDISFIILDRVSFVDAGSDMLTVQTVPPSIYCASYPHWFFNKKKLIAFFEKRGYTVACEWSNHIDKPVFVNGRICNWESLYFLKSQPTADR